MYIYCQVIQKLAVLQWCLIWVRLMILVRNWVHHQFSVASEGRSVVLAPWPRRTIILHKSAGEQLQSSRTRSSRPFLGRPGVDDVYNFYNLVHLVWIHPICWCMSRAWEQDQQRAVQQTVWPQSSTTCTNYSTSDCWCTNHCNLCHQWIHVTGRQTRTGQLRQHRINKSNMYYKPQQEQCKFF